MCEVPLEATGGLLMESQCLRPISPSHQHPRGLLGPSPWKRSWVRCQAVTPYVPSSSAQPRGLPTSLRSSGGAGMSGGHLRYSSSKGSAPSASWALRNQGGRCPPAALAVVGAASSGERARGQRAGELACLWGGLACVLWSGLPGAQVNVSPELPLPRRGLPAHSPAPERGGQQKAQP